MSGRPPVLLKQLARRVLECPRILESPREISNELKISYESAKKLKKRYLKKMNGTPYLCPLCLSPLHEIEDGLVCKKCGFFHETPSLPVIGFNHTFLTALYDLGTENEWKGRGFERFRQEALSEVRAFLKGFSLPSPILDKIGREIRRNALLYFTGRNKEIDRFRLILTALIAVGEVYPPLKRIAWQFLRGD